jgi:hypothetical protein
VLDILAVKNAVKNVRSLLFGKPFVVHAVDADYECDQETRNVKKTESEKISTIPISSNYS